MTAVTTTRAINFEQLAVEVGVASLRGESYDGETWIVEDLSGTLELEVLQAAVDKHVPAPPPPTPAELAAAQQGQIDDLLLDYLDTTTNQQDQLDELILASLG